MHYLGRLNPIDVVMSSQVGRQVFPASKWFANTFDKAFTTSVLQRYFSFFEIRRDSSGFFFINGPTRASFLFIFVPLKHKFYGKTVSVRDIQTPFVGVEGEHADHLTTIMAQPHPASSFLYFVNFRVAKTNQSQKFLSTQVLTGIGIQTRSLLIMSVFLQPLVRGSHIASISTVKGIQLQ